MTDAQSNKLDMYIVVNDFHTAYLSILDAIPARAAAFGKLAFNIAAINGEIGGQSASTTGVTQDKATLRDTLNSISISLLAPAKSWALSTANNTLAAEFNYTVTDLQRIKDDTITGFCTHRHDLMNANIASMADFGILPPALTAWEEVITSYAAILASPRKAINTRHMHTASLKRLFSATSKLFSNQLDPLMLPLSITEPKIHAAYKQARIIINRGGSAPPPTPPQTPQPGRASGQMAEQAPSFQL